MPSPDVLRAQEWLRAHEAELLSDTIEMLRINSIESAPEPNAPFGAGNRKALDLALSMAERDGFRVKDIDGYAGYAEFGEGERLIVSLGHLDVVPVGDGWKHEPFGAEIDGGYIYARGSTDDKGPTMASYYAARALKETCPGLPGRIRIVFGCNEESGMKCVEKYYEVEGAPTLGVAPDSGWPLYHGEKGIANLQVELSSPKSDFQVVSIAGGQRPNIVIDACTASVQVAQSIRSEIEDKLASAWDKNVQWSWSGDRLEVQAIGKAAHGAFPFGGDSAATRLFRFLRELSPLSTQTLYDELMESAHISGVGLGIHGRDDESQDLTCNLGIVSSREGFIELLFNIRYPVTWTGDQLKAKCVGHLADLKSGWKLASMDDSPSLYFPLDHPLVRTVCEVHKVETGEDKAPGTMGGGTYARKLPNTVSIGTGWEGDGNAHETDERLAIESLHKMSRIYAHILYRLVKLESN